MPSAIRALSLPFAHVADTSVRVADLSVAVAALLWVQFVNVGRTPVVSPEPTP